MPQYRIVSGTVADTDCDPAVAVIAAITGKTLSIRSFMVSGVAAAQIQIQDDAGTPVVIIPDMHIVTGVGMAALTGGPYEPGSFKATKGQAIDVLSSTGDKISCLLECYVL